MVMTTLVDDNTGTEGQLRLVNGSNMFEGRLEIYHGGSWGTICGREFKYVHASIACRQLGLPDSNPTLYHYAFFGLRLYGRIHFDHIYCRGTEVRLTDCSLVRHHYCGHMEDVGISCNPVPEYESYSLEPSVLEDLMVTTTLMDGNTVSEGQLRLVNGGNMYEGRLEIYYAGVWGTICDDNFGSREARVACRELGMPDRAVRVYPYAQFGQGYGGILLDQVSCRGGERRLVYCTSNGWGSHDCSHSEDVGISCADGATTPEVTDQSIIDVSAYQQSEYQPYSLEPSVSDDPMVMTTLVDDNTATEGQLRLVNGSNMYEGRLEIYHGGIWGTICGREFDYRDASVACRQLGLPDSNPVVYYDAHFGRGGGPVHFDHVTCSGRAIRLTHCELRRWHSCVDFVVGIECNQNNTYSSATPPIWYHTTQTTKTESSVPGIRIHTAATLINPYRHGATHCLRLVYRPRDRYANPGDLLVRFVPRNGLTSSTVLWQNTGEQSRKWYSHNHDVYISTPGWILIDDNNAYGNIEIAEQTVTRGTCDYIET